MFYLFYFPEIEAQVFALQAKRQGLTENGTDVESSGGRAKVT